MRYAIVIARIVLGLIFVFFGSNILIGFLHMPAPTGNAGLFMQAVGPTGWMKVIGLLQVVGGLLLLVGRFVPLGLVFLGPVIVNVFLFHAFLAPSGLPVALVVVILETFLLFVYRESFAGLFRAEPLAKT